MGSLTNAQEVLFGSDPYSVDSDREGLTDSVEFIYLQDALTAGTPLLFAPWLWDSNDNVFSDFDEYYQQIHSYQPVVNYASLHAGSTGTVGAFYTFSDADGEGVVKAEDNDPLNMDSYGSAVLNWIDVGNMDYASSSNSPTSNPYFTVSDDGDGINNELAPTRQTIRNNVINRKK